MLITLRLRWAATAARYRSSLGKHTFASNATRIGRRLRLCWSDCSDDRAADAHADLDCGRHYGSAPRLHRPERDGADEAGTGSLFGTRVCVPWSTWSSH